MPLSADEIEKKIERVRELALLGAKAEAADMQIVEAMNIGFDLAKQMLLDLRTIAEKAK